jgi:hypothetical protein
MPGLDPGIHEAVQRIVTSRKSEIGERPHGLPGQGNDAERIVLESKRKERS